MEENARSYTQGCLGAATISSSAFLLFFSPFLPPFFLVFSHPPRGRSSGCPTPALRREPDTRFHLCCLISCPLLPCSSALSSLSLPRVVRPFRIRRPASSRLLFFSPPLLSSLTPGRPFARVNRLNDRNRFTTKSSLPVIFCNFNVSSFASVQIRFS